MWRVSGQVIDRTADERDFIRQARGIGRVPPILMVGRHKGAAHAAVNEDISVVALRARIIEESDNTAKIVVLVFDLFIMQVRALGEVCAASS